MQTETVNSITLTYPDEPVMVFNPVPLSVSGTLSRLSVTIGTHVVVYNTPNGGTVDIREWLQGQFTALKMGGDLDYTQALKVSEAGKTIAATVAALDTDGTTLATFSLSLFCVWGGLKTGEHYGRHRTVTWFQNYPFTVGVYAAASGQFSVGVNSAPSNIIANSGQGVYNILIDDANGGRYMTIFDIVGSLDQGTFEDVFDLTFDWDLDGTIDEIVRINLVTRDINEGIYLRWIDRHGFWNYWLFKEGDGTRNAASRFGTWYRNNLAKWEEIYHWQQDSGRRQSLTRNDVVPVCAPLVDQETFDMLQDVTTSPCVDMYLGLDSNDVPKWTAVTIEAGSYTKDVRKPEQDFVMNVVMPEIPVQTL